MKGAGFISNPSPQQRTATIRVEQVQPVKVDSERHIVAQLVRKVLSDPEEKLFAVKIEAQELVGPDRQHERLLGYAEW